MNFGKFYSNRYAIQSSIGATVFTTIFLTATVYNSQVFAAVVSQDAAKQAATTVLGPRKQNMTASSDGSIYIGDKVGFVFIKPNAADLEKDPLVFRYVLGVDHKGDDLAVNFTDYRDGGFICSAAGSAYNLAALIAHQQKQFFETIIRQATYESKYIRSVRGYGTTTGSRTTLCFQPLRLNEPNLGPECSAAVDKFYSKAKAKNDRAIKNFISMGALPVQWNFSTPKNYHVNPAKGGFDKKIFPDDRTTVSRCYTRYEVVDAMKKFGDWLKTDVEAAKKQFNQSIYKGGRYTDYANKLYKEREEKNQN